MNTERKIKINELQQKLLSLEHKIKRKLRQEFDQDGISFNQYRVLRKISHLSSPTISELGKKSHIRKSNMTKVIDDLVKKGYLERKRDSEDRRIIRLDFTSSGIKLQQQLQIQEQRIVEKLFQNISSEKINDYLIIIDEIDNSIPDEENIKQKSGEC